MANLTSINFLLIFLYNLGASAASAALRNSGGGGESPEGEELDQGDGINNELVLR